MIDAAVHDTWIIRFQKEALPLIWDRFHPKKVFIFGSRAKGVQTEESDLDIIIVSDYFRDIPFVKRYGMLFSLIKFPIHVDYICYTSEEFEDNKTRSVVIHDALTGPVVAL